MALLLSAAWVEPGLTQAQPSTTLGIEVLAEHGVGDGRLATEIPIGDVADVATLADGTVYFVDNVHLRVRRIGVDGIIGTVFNGHEIHDQRNVQSSPSAIAIDATRNRIYVADEGANRVWVVLDTGTEAFAGSGEFGLDGDYGPASAARLNTPTDVAVGPDGTVYIADMANHRVRAVGLNGVIRTVVGSLAPEVDFEVARNSSGLFLPTQVDITPDGALFIVDRHGRRLQQVAPNGASITQLPTIGVVSGLSMSGDEHLVVSHGGRATEWRNGGWATVPLQNQPGASQRAVAARGPDVVTHKPQEHKLVRRAAGGSAAVIGGNGSIGRLQGSSAKSSFGCQDVALKSNNQIVFSDPLNKRIGIVNADGKVGTLAGYADGGELLGGLSFDPLGIAIDSLDRIYIADYAHHRILRTVGTGTTSVIAGNGSEGFGGDGGPAAEAAMNTPGDIAIGASGDLYVSDAGNTRIRRIDAQGNISTAFELDFAPGALAFGPNGALLVMERVGHTLVELRLQPPVSVRYLVGGPSGTGSIPARMISGITAYGTSGVLIGAANTLLFARVPEAMLPPQTATELGSLGGFANATAMVADGNGNLVVCDGTRRRILRIAASELESPIASLSQGGEE